MGRQGYVYVDEATITYPKNSAITIAGAAIGFKEEYKKTGNITPNLVLYDFWAIAKRSKKIKKKDWDVLGMLVADGLVALHKPNHFVTPNTYFVCSEIGGYVVPYLADHEWRQETRYDRRLRRRIAENVELTNCNSEAKKYYRMKQSIGRMLVNQLDGINIPYEIMQRMKFHPNLIINARTLEPVTIEQKPKYWKKN